MIWLNIKNIVKNKKKRQQIFPTRIYSYNKNLIYNNIHNKFFCNLFIHFIISSSKIFA